MTIRLCYLKTEEEIENITRQAKICILFSGVKNNMLFLTPEKKFIILYRQTDC